MVYANFKRYDYQGHRLAIFGIPIVNTDQMEIFVLKCSKKDQFNKNLAWQVYAAPGALLNGKQYHPKKYIITIDPEHSKLSFRDHVRLNYFVKVRHKAGIFKQPLLDVNIQRVPKFEEFISMSVTTLEII